MIRTIVTENLLTMTATILNQNEIKMFLFSSLSSIIGSWDERLLFVESIQMLCYICYNDEHHHREPIVAIVLLQVSLRMSESN